MATDKMFGQVDNIISQMGMDGLLQSPEDLPPDPYEMGVEVDHDMVLRTGEIEKMCPGAVNLWQKRQGTLTADWFGWSTVGESLVVELIPLLDVTDVLTTGETDEDFDPMLLHRGDKQDKSNSNRKKQGNGTAQKQQSYEELVKDKLVVFTDVEGRNSGKVFWFRVADEAEAQAWCENIKSHAAVAKKTSYRDKHTFIQRLRLLVRRWYESEYVQIVFAILIAANFVTNVAEAQVVPQEGSSEETLFFNLDVFFTSAFGFELAWNMFCHGYKEFWFDGWNVFDFTVVCFSVLALIVDSVPVLSSLRLLRVFRAVRLFKKLSSLRILFNALLGSIIPVLNSVFILVIITAMYSIVAVELYGPQSELFVDFTQAMFTMYQVATGDSWASGVARVLFDKDPDTDEVEFDDTSMPFFVSYTVITGMILLNVVVAVLLDNFTRCVSAEEQATQQAKAAQVVTRAQKSCTVLSPILQDLINYENEQHLDEMIHMLFEAVDVNANATLSFEELRVGLHKLNTQPTIVLSQDDFDSITRDRTWTLENGYVNLEFWEKIVRDQLQAFIRRKVADALREHDPKSDIAVELMALKMALVRTEPDWYSDVTALLDPSQPQAPPPPQPAPPAPPLPASAPDAASLPTAPPTGGTGVSASTRSILRDTGSPLRAELKQGPTHTRLNGGGLGSASVSQASPKVYSGRDGGAGAASPLVQAAREGGQSSPFQSARERGEESGKGNGNGKAQVVATTAFMSLFESVGKAFGGGSEGNGQHGAFGGGLVAGGAGLEAGGAARELSNHPGVRVADDSDGGPQQFLTSEEATGGLPEEALLTARNSITL